MRTKTVEKVMKNSIVCGYAITQPFAFYIDAQPIIQDKLLTEADGLAYGENSKIVRNLQYKLTKLGHYDDGIDGVYGLLTEHAIKGFQSSHEITVTGAADKQTMEALIMAERQSEIDEIAELARTINYDSTYEEVRAVQEVLFYYGYYTGTVDGLYGPLTEDAVNQIINLNLLSPPPTDSEVSEQVDNELAEQIAPSKDSQLQKDEDIVQLNVNHDNSSVIQVAKSYMGTPYVWGGTTPNGFDCSGFIQFVYKQNDIMIPRTVNEIWNFSTNVESPSIGDLVFFETYQPGPSHLGIYLGNGDFIHAGSSNGVQISNLSDSYWSPRYLGAKRIK
ncbi:NlpC/P60 family protein [Pseudogracilibacillus sp. SE30717A]|uniref:C40 family peptidase n=1 Tax=Pseudogracilibacillus sp. SE30717A TaxID=3098293 RepID=UPI00300E57F7